MNNTTAKLSGGGNFHVDLYDQIISLKNLFQAWDEFRRGKTKKQDVLEFAENIEDHVFGLNKILLSGTYRHGLYKTFYVCDPKRRCISKPAVADRVLHHAIYRILEPIFEKSFIFDSYSSRKGKGMHKAGNRFNRFAWKLSRNNTRTVWILKCDIKKYFDSVDHRILETLLSKKIKDEKVTDLLSRIIGSFKKTDGKGIPLGNLTSQLFSNIYLDPLDQYLKRSLRVKNYVRYADDFIVLSEDKDHLLELTPKIGDFLEENLKLQLHPDKVFIKTLGSGVDFLGWIHFPTHRVLRTTTKRRMLKRVGEKNADSYLGMLNHGNGHKLTLQIERFQSSG